MVILESILLSGLAVIMSHLYMLQFVAVGANDFKVVRFDFDISWGICINDFM
jgi:hypothetical protein